MKQSNQGKTDEKEFDSTPDTPVIHLSATPIHSSERSSDSNILLSEGFEEHHIETVQQTVETSSDKGSVTTSQPRPASSSYSDSEPESPRSPSPKVSPGSKSPSPRVSINNSHPDLERQSSSPVGESEHEEDDADDISPLMKETDQELLDEMIVKDVPESESSTDPVKKFEETLPSTNIESIKEEDSDTEYPERPSSPSDEN